MASLPTLVGIRSEDEDENCILLDVLLAKIIENVPIAEWSKLEGVSKQFQRCVQNAYWTLKTLNMKNVFLPEFGRNIKKGNEKVFNQFLSQITQRCPLLQAISGFDCGIYEISLEHFNLLCKLKKLNNFSLKNVTVNINHLSCFLKTFPQITSLQLNSLHILAADRYRNLNDDDCGFFANFYGLVELKISGIWCCSMLNSMVNAESLKVLKLKNYFKATHINALLNRAVNLETLFLFDPTTCSQQNCFGLELLVLQCLPNLTKLRKFSLVIQKVMGCFGPLKSVTEYTSDDLMDILASCQSLRDISVDSGYMSIVTDHFLNRLISECPLLESLKFSATDCRSEEIMSNVVNLQHLKRLVIEDAWHEYILKRLCTKLHNLDNLSHLTMIGDIEEEELVSLKHLKNLTRLDCYRGIVTETVSQRWIEAGFMKKLTFLRINFVYGIMKSFFENVPNLRTFVYYGKLDDDILLTIANGCKHLQTLAIEHCSGITENGLLQLLLNCYNLRCLVVGDSFHDIMTSNVLFQPFKHIVCFSYRAKY